MARKKSRPDASGLFFMGPCKNVIYKTSYETVQDLRVAVENVRRIHHNTLQKATRNEFQRRLNLCIRNEGSHFEQLISLIIKVKILILNSSSLNILIINNFLSCLRILRIRIDDKIKLMLED